MGFDFMYVIREHKTTSDVHAGNLHFLQGKSLNPNHVSNSESPVH